MLDLWGIRHPCSGEGRSGARPDLASEAWALDRPPALFSKVEENLRRRLHRHSGAVSRHETLGDIRGFTLVSARESLFVSSVFAYPSLAGRSEERRVGEECR